MIIHIARKAGWHHETSFVPAIRKVAGISFLCLLLLEVKKDIYKSRAFNNPAA